MKRFYELTYLVNPNLDQKELESFNKQIKEAILSFEGEIKNELQPTKIKLGYPIEKIDIAHLVSFDLELSPNKLSELKKFIEEKQEILRYIIFKKKIPKIPAPTIVPTKTERAKIKFLYCPNITFQKGSR